jgi:hypothetical protein
LRLGRLHAGAFYAVCLGGALVACGLAISEATQDEPVTVGDVRHTRAGLVATVEAPVTNSSDVRRCPEVRAAARDTEARDLAEATARPLTGGPELAPGQTVTYRAVVRGLTAEDFREKLKEYSMYVYRLPRCAGAQP